CPVEYWPSDGLYLAGRPHRNPTGPLLLDHVVVSASHLIVHSDEQLLNLRVYGLPESRLRDGLGFEEKTGRYWVNNPNLHPQLRETIGVSIGSPRTAWNLAARYDGL